VRKCQATTKLGILRALARKHSVNKEVCGDKEMSNCGHPFLAKSPWRVLSGGRTVRVTDEEQGIRVLAFMAKQEERGVGKHKKLQSFFAELVSLFYHE